MNIAIGTNLISDSARNAIVTCGGRIESTLKPDIAMVVLPESAEFLSSNEDHAYIALGESEDAQVLHFTRAWHTKDCRLDLCE